MKLQKTLLALLCVGALSSCGEKKPDANLEYLKKGIAEIQVSDGASQLGYENISFRAEDTTVVFTKEVSIAGTSDAAECRKMLDENFIVGTLWSQPQLYEAMVKAGANAEIDFRAAGQGGWKKDYSNAELARLAEANTPRSRLIENYLANQCALTNAMAPVPVELGLEITHMSVQTATGEEASDIADEETYIAVDFATDNYAPSFPKDDEKRLYILKQEIREGNETITGLCRLAAETGSGLRLTYASAKGGASTVSYSPVDIMHLRLPE